MSPKAGLFTWDNFGRYVVDPVRGGEGNAILDWETIARKHGPRVFRVAYRILGSVQDAEDVSQEVFLEAFRVYEAGPVQSWIGLLVRLATLRSLDHRRRKRPNVELDERDCQHVDDPAARLVKAELAERLRHAVSSLADQQATVFVMAFYEQMSRDAIAETLDISPESVSTSLYKARQRLSQVLFPSREESHR